MWPTSRLLHFRSNGVRWLKRLGRLSVLGSCLLLSGCNRINGDSVSQDAIVLPTIQKVNVFRPERVESVDTDYVFFGKLVQSPQQQQPLLVVTLPAKLADDLPEQQELSARNRKSRTTCKLIEVDADEKPPGSRAARFSITPNVVQAGWEFTDSIETRLTISRARRGYWVPISALCQNNTGQETTGDWSLFTATSDETDEASDSFRIGAETVHVVYYDDDWVLVDCENTLDTIVADGTHRIVEGQAVQLRDVTGQRRRSGSAPAVSERTESVE